MASSGGGAPWAPGRRVKLGAKCGPSTASASHASGKRHGPRATKGRRPGQRPDAIRRLPGRRLVRLQSQKRRGRTTAQARQARATRAACPLPAGEETAPGPRLGRRPRGSPSPVRSSPPPPPPQLLSPVTPSPLLPVPPSPRPPQPLRGLVLTPSRPLLLDPSSPTRFSPLSRRAARGGRARGDRSSAGGGRSLLPRLASGSGSRRRSDPRRFRCDRTRTNPGIVSARPLTSARRAPRRSSSGHVRAPAANGALRAAGGPVRSCVRACALVPPRAGTRRPLRWQGRARPDHARHQVRLTPPALVAPVGPARL